MKKRKESTALDYDTRWKVIIEKHPERFIHRFFPDIYPQVDFASFRPRFLRQEIHKLVARKKKRGGMKPDLVLEVRLHGGERRFLYTHIEVQHRHEVDFGAKMFRPFYWIYDTYGVEIAAIAIFVGPTLPKNHDHFEYVFGQTKLRYDYPVVVVKELDEQKLKESGDMFDLALLACMYVLRTQGRAKAQDRYELSKDLMGYILESPLSAGLTDEERISVMELSLNLLSLPPELELKLNQDIQDKYINPSEMQRLDTHRERNLTDALSTAFYGQPASVMAKKLKKAETDLKRAEAEKQRAAEKERAKTIHKLHSELKFSAEKIAHFLELEVAYVQAVLDKDQAIDNLPN